MAQSQVASVNTRSNIGRSFLFALGAVGGMGITGADEILVSAPFIALHEALGLLLGFVAAVAFWALLGLISLLAYDWLWPPIKPYWALTKQWLDKVGGKMSTHLLSDLNILNSSLALISAAATITLAIFFVGDVVNLLSDNAVFVGLLCAVIVVVFLLFAIYEQGEELIKQFVNFVPGIARPKVRLGMKFLAGLFVLVYMGPVLSRPFLYPLGVKTKGWAYILTFAAAPFFSGLWYFVYNFGVWDNIERVLF